ncbi:regulatory protein RecX [Kozakia baliensis]|uniref:Regulatory protein RecX n=1 Tax=Kozakia baliensis TaxID=153496 RepID=A0A1D8UXG7_9PROT|nr:RecX family transcriptional regulator [Kozakia baliensis]AOX18309.1 recombinase A [Kozakia baliensis]
MSAEMEPPPPPNAASLREAALAHVARFATTEQGLQQALVRRVRRWGVRAERAGAETTEIEGQLQALLPAIDEIVRDMVRLGALNDHAFAQSRSRGLTRSGRSRRAVTAHLMQRGVEHETLSEALDEALGERHDAAAYENELGAALVLARKRRLGPFRRPDAPEPDLAAHQKALAAFARAGFGRDIAEQALAFDPEEAEERVLMLKSS